MLTALFDPFLDGTVVLAVIGKQEICSAHLAHRIVEAEIITKRYELMDDAVLTLHKSFFHFGTIQNWVNVHWRGSFTALLVIGPGIWRPLYDKIDTIQKMSETRGDVGAQFMLVRA